MDKDTHPTSAELKDMVERLEVEAGTLIARDHPLLTRAAVKIGSAIAFINEFGRERGQSIE